MAAYYDLVVAYAAGVLFKLVLTCGAAATAATLLACVVGLAKACNTPRTRLDRTRVGDRVAAIPRSAIWRCGCSGCGSTDPMPIVVAAHDRRGGTTTCVAMCGRRVVGVFVTFSERYVATADIVRGEYGLPELVDGSASGDCRFAVDRRVTPAAIVHDAASARRQAGALAVALQHPARVVQRAWRRAVSDPSSLACRRRLMREFAEGGGDIETGRVHHAWTYAHMNCFPSPGAVAVAALSC
jgi:hypothetical protein